MKQILPILAVCVCLSACASKTPPKVDNSRVVASHKRISDQIAKQENIIEEQEKTLDELYRKLLKEQEAME